MILRVIIGSGARGLLSYIAGQSKTGNADDRPFFTNMCGQTVRELSKEISCLRKLRPNLKKAIAHVILSHDPKDRFLTETEWKHAISVALKAHGAEDAPFAAYIHKDTNHQHSHLFFLRLTKSNKVISDSHNFRKNETAARLIEKELKLNSPVQQPNPTAPGNRQALENASRRAERQGIPVISAQTLREAIGSATSRTNFSHLLGEKNIETEFQTRGKAQEIYGYRVKIKGTKEWISASTLGKDLSWPKIAHRFKNDELEVPAPVAATMHRKSKMPQMLKPLMASTHGIREVHTHAAHQTEVMDAPRLNKAISNLSVGPASRAMLLIGFALINFSAEIVRRIIALMRRILAVFGFGMRESRQLQKYEHPSGEATCYVPTLSLTAPAVPSAEDNAANELSRIAVALESNSPNELPAVEGAEMERADAVAAMSFPDRLSGVATVAEDDDFGIPDEDFSSGAAAVTAENHKTDLIKTLKVAVEADKIAREALDRAKTKKIPFHIDISDRTGEEVDIVVKALDLAKANFERWKSKNFIKAQFPSITKNNFEYEIANLEKQKTEVTEEHKKATAKTAEHERINRNLPEPVVPMSVLLNAEAASQAVKTARETIQSEALSLIESIKSNPH